MYIKLLAALALSLTLIACKAPVEEYASTSPIFDIRDYFNGPIEAGGIMRGFGDNQELSFTADLRGEWDGDTGKLYETFQFSDGRTDQRDWTFTMLDDHHFIGTAADVVGEAKGTQYGNTVHMIYELALERPDGTTINVMMDDWLYRVDEDTVINLTDMKKFGLPVRELIIAFNKE